MLPSIQANCSNQASADFAKSFRPKSMSPARKQVKMSVAFELHVSEAGIGGFAFVLFTIIVAWLKRFKKRLEKKMQRLMMMGSVEQARAWSRRSRLGCC